MDTTFASKTLANIGGFCEDNVVRDLPTAQAAYKAALAYIDREKPLNTKEIKELLKKSLDTLIEHYNKNVKM